MPEEKIILVDGNSYLHRAFHALPKLTDASGDVVNAVYGFVKMLRKVMSEVNPTHILVAFDHKKPTFRHKDFAEYKAHRPESDKDLSGQFQRLFSVLDALNIKHIDYEGFEADDIIATFTRMAREQNIDTVIVTGDKDILQLIDEGVSVLNGMKNIIYSKENVKKHFGVEADQITDYLALIGDRSDNLPGVRGIGPVTARKLIEQFGNLESVYGNIGEVSSPVAARLQNGKDDAFNTRRLAVLVENLDMSLTISDCRWKGPDPARLRKELSGLNFRNLISDWLSPDELIGETSFDIISTVEGLDEFLSRHRGIPAAIEAVFRSGEQAPEIPVGIGISFDGRNSAYIPLGHSYLGVNSQPDWEPVIRSLGAAAASPGFCAWAYDIKEIYKLFKSGCSVPVPIGFDVITADHLAGTGPGGGSLKDICSRYLDWIPSEYEAGAAEQEIDSIARTVSAKLAAVFQLEKILRPILRESGVLKLYEEIELPLACILGEMELTGISIDTAGLKETESEFKKELRQLEAVIFDYAGGQFNINSPVQLSSVLFEKLGLEPVRKTKSGFSTAEDVLQQLMEAHPLPGLVLEYRHLQKLLSTYVEPLPRLLDSRTHKLHTTFNIAGTATGRLSSTEPNLQNIPARTKEGCLIRRAFVPSEGCVFISADYSQIDLRVMAHISGDPELIDSFRLGDDVHRRTASQVFEVPEEEVTPEMRKKAKAVNFGIVYGMSSWGLSKKSDMDNAESGEFIEKYFERHPGIKNYMERVKEEASRDGFVTTLLGRRRYLPEMNSSNFSRRRISERAAINTPIQGSSADIIKAAMVSLAGEFPLNDGPLKLILQIHDELLFEVPGKKFREYIPKIKMIMEGAVELSVPLVVDFKQGRNLRDLDRC